MCLSPADRRPVFAPRARQPGDDNDPSLLGVLFAGGDEGKTEMMDGFTWSTVLVGSLGEAERLADRLKPQIEAWTDAPVRLAAWPSRDEPETWVLSPRERVLRVQVPFHREDLLPWRLLFTGRVG